MVQIGDDGDLDEGGGSRNRGLECCEVHFGCKVKRALLMEWICSLLSLPSMSSLQQLSSHTGPRVSLFPLTTLWRFNSYTIQFKDFQCIHKVVYPSLQSILEHYPEKKLCTLSHNPSILPFFPAPGKQ